MPDSILLLPTFTMHYRVNILIKKISLSVTIAVTPLDSERVRVGDFYPRYEESFYN